MRDAKGLNLKQCLPRMSWNHRNLFNIWRRSQQRPEKPREPFTESRMVTFKSTRASLFQQRWKSKALVRGYHGDHINEKIFKRWYLPNTLPDVRPRQTILGGDDKSQLDLFARRKAHAEKEKKRLEEEERKGMAPVGSLMFTEVERRIDVFIFRCCFAHSVYEARRLVVHGYVLLNGKKHSNANTRLAPGDMVSVDPKAIRMLQSPANMKSQETTTESSVTSEAPAESEPATEPAASAEIILESESTPNPSQPSKSKPTTPSKSQMSPLEGILSGRDSVTNKPMTPFTLPPFASPFLFVPAYCEVSFQTCSAVYVRHPTARPGYSEIPTPFEADGEIVRLAWEWYAKCRPRMRSKKQVSRMPDNRKSAEEIAAGAGAMVRGRRELPPHAM